METPSVTDIVTQKEEVVTVDHDIAPDVQAKASKIWSVLRFLKLIDDQNTLSITNIAVMVVLCKFLLSKDAIQPLDLGALIGTLTSYQSKRYIEKAAQVAKVITDE